MTHEEEIIFSQKNTIILGAKKMAIGLECFRKNYTWILTPDPIYMAMKDTFELACNSLDVREKNEVEKYAKEVVQRHGGRNESIL